jgi:hypothetical protein
MPIFTAAAVFIAEAIGVTSVLGIAAINLGVRVVAAYVVSSLVTKRDPGTPTSNSTTGSGGGSRVQLQPATENRLPVVYGSAFVSPIIIDAKISTDQKTMWYVMALSEVTDTGTISFNRQYWGDKELFFDTGDKTKVAYWTDTNNVTNTNVAGNMYIYYYNNGSANPTNTTLKAWEVLSDSQIESTQRWPTTNTMTNVAFAIVKVIYNTTAGLTGSDQFKVQLVNTLYQPGSVIKDYLHNTRYGCAISYDNIDTDALTALDTYSAQQISYINPAGGPLLYQDRYTINGPIDTNNNCLVNLQAMVDSCDSWLQWNETYNKWSVKINRSYTDYTTFESLFAITSSNIIGGVNITPVDLNSTYNIVEAHWPNSKIKDQSDYAYVTLPTVDRNPNEPDNKLDLQLPLVNNLVQATYLSTRRLIQSRDDLIIDISLDYSGIQIEAGDVVRVYHNVYGWDGKLFLVNQVIESKADDGSLGAKVSLFEYNEQVYQNISITDFVPDTNTGIPNPFWITTPEAPYVTSNNVPGGSGAISAFTVSGHVPATGTILYMDFYYGTTPDASTYKLYQTVTAPNGQSFTNNQTINLTVNDLTSNTYYWSVRARSSANDTGTTGGSKISTPSAPHTWPGATVLPVTQVNGSNVGGINYSMMQAGATGAFPYTKYNSSVGYPVNVTTTSARNVPLIYPGTTQSDTFPWYNDSPRWNSATGGALAWTSEGANGWYTAISVNVSTISIDPGELFQVNGYLNLVTDTANTTIQVMLFYDFGVNGIVLEQVNMQTFTIPNAGAYPYLIPLVHVASVAASASRIGFAIRNLTASTNVTIFAGALGVKQVK